jgi:hypothetical protein
MVARPLKVVLDSHAFGRLEGDAVSSDLLRDLIAESKIAVLVPKVIQDALQARSAAPPSWLPYHDVPDATKASADVLVSDDRRCRRRARSSRHFDRALTYDEWVELLKDYGSADRAS